MAVAQAIYLQHVHGTTVSAFHSVRSLPHRSEPNQSIDSEY
ncbi:hypothetical protein R2A130_2685 [Ahrensia sp. R2A130]|nr:hypothetical protein R2A130_2685 [Ahrensia sp. R2A130]